MLFRTLLGMRWGDLSDDVRQMLLERADSIRLTGLTANDTVKGPFISAIP